MKPTVVLLALSLCMALASLAPADDVPQLALSSDFEGGSGTVVSIDSARRIISFKPTDHKDRGVVAWWYFKVSGIKPGETITLELQGGTPGVEGWARPERAAFSLDDKTWTQTAPAKRNGMKLSYQQKVDAAEAWFAWGPPFLPSHAQALVDRLAKQSPHAEAVELARSAEGRSVPAIKIAQPGASEADRYGVFICARQHAWEVSGSWACQGLLEWLLSDDPRAETLRTKASFYVVPLMDVDNVANGAGGKGEKPHDHNRDWCDTPHFPAVAAAIGVVKAMDKQGQLDLALDLHGPGEKEMQPFFYIPRRGTVSDRRLANVKRFMAAAQREMVGPPKLSPKQWSSGPGEEAWNQHAETWISAHTADHVAAAALEVPFNTPHSTIDGYRELGKQLGLAIDLYFRVNPRDPVAK